MPLWIDTKIVYEPNGRLSLAYNRAMQNTTAEWVLFLDQDIFLTNPHWYIMCLNAIRQVGKEAGWITARCNRIASSVQLYKPRKDNNDILNHVGIAKRLYEKFGSSLKQVTYGKLSGFFLLTSKEAWKKVGGFNEGIKGMGGVDRDYCKRLLDLGYKLYVMEGLYLYHLYRVMRKENWNA